MAVDFTLSASRRKAEMEREEEERAMRPPGLPAAPKILTPKEEADALLARLGDLSGIKLFGNRVLVAKFIRTHIGTSGKLLAAKQTNDEDKWQGKVGLVVMKGTIAFQDDESTVWHGDDVAVGDWVFYQYGDGTDVDVGDVHCKILKEGEIAGVIPRPDFFF